MLKQSFRNVKIYEVMCGMEHKIYNFLVTNGEDLFGRSRYD